jgi:uncharacterized protein (TIGR00297 family)
MGITVLLFCDWLLLIPLVIFFATSSALTHLPYGLEDEDQHRTFGQVFANGSIAWLALIMYATSDMGLWSQRDALAICLGAIASANADTWATELGVRYGGGTHDILKGRSVDAGTSGGVSGVGTMGSILGAGAIAITVPLFGEILCPGWIPIVVVTASGFLGSIVDSLLGSTLQLRYRCRRCGQLTESATHCDTETSTRGGILTNSQVNWFCTVAGAAASWFWLCR